MNLTSRVRSSPRISVNKLGEYITSSPIRRRTILRNQKYPSEIIITRYNDCVDPIINFFADPVHDPGRLHRAIEEIRVQPALNDNQVTTRRVNIEALTRLLEAHELLTGNGLAFRRLPDQAPHLKIADVEVSVRPELEIVRTDRQGAIRYGLLKLYLKKSHPLEEDTAKYIATTLHQYAELNYGPAEAVDPPCCLVLDIFAKRTHSAPRNYRNRRGDIVAACEEIGSRWSTL
jgi:hypothetical protein